MNQLHRRRPRRHRPVLLLLDACGGTPPYDQHASGRRGAKFDSSRDRGQPFASSSAWARSFRGWDEGVVGMQVGGARELHIPAFLGYGAEGAGRTIPPGASLAGKLSEAAVG